MTIKNKTEKSLIVLSSILFVSLLHGLMIGTDLKNIYLSSLYLLASFTLVLLYLSNLVFLIQKKYIKKD